MIQNSEIYCVLLILGFAMTELVCGDCSADSGPSGATECFLGWPYYHQYQWGTCLTQTYIETFSKGKYHCRDRSATYCYYQCMLEAHELDEGPVYDDCACDPNAVSGPTTPVLSTTPALPDWCFSPDGTSCLWYTECLEKRHSCLGTGYGYAVDYALKFCNLYSENQHKFLPKGQRWIDAVRKCLQVELVPLLRPYVKTNCADIEAFAFRSHAPCYLDPYPGEPSICDLECAEWAKVFWTLKGAFITAFNESLQGMLSVTKGCASLSSFPTLGNCSWSLLKATGRAGMRLVRFVIRKVNAAVGWFKHLIGKRSAPLDFDEVAGNFADQLAAQLEWEKDGVQWFAFAGNNSRNISDADEMDINISDADEMDINILLGSRAEYDLNAVGVPEADMNKTVDELAVAIGNEQIQLDIGKNLNVTQFSACLDMDCQDTYHEVIPKLKKAKPHVSRSSAISKRTVLITLSIIIKVLLK